MSEMVQRLARAMFRHDQGPLKSCADAEYETHREFWESAARAALAALREPTPEMLARTFGSTVEDMAEQAHGVMIWQGMIDAALRDPTP